MSDTGVGEMTRSAFSQAAASNNTNKEALGAQDGDSHASAASDTSAQLTARAILTIQRRAIDGRSGRPTPSKVDSLIRQAQDQADATGTRLTDDFTLLEQLPIKHSADGGSDGGSVSDLSTDGALLQALPSNFRQSRKKRTAPTNTETTLDNNDNDNTQPGKMQAPGPPTETAGAAGGQSAPSTTTNTGGVKPTPNLDDPPDAATRRQIQDYLSQVKREHEELLDEMEAIQNVSKEQHRELLRVKEHLEEATVDRSEAQQGLDDLRTKTSRDRNQFKAAKRELAEERAEFEKNKNKKPSGGGGGGGGGGGSGGGGGGGGGPTNTPPADDNVEAAQLLEITDALENFLKARGMSLHDYRTTCHTFINGNQSVVNTHLWEHRDTLLRESSFAAQLDAVADLFMLAEDAKKGVPTMPKIMRDFKTLQKSDIQAMAHSDFLTVHTQFVEQFSGAFHSIIRNVTNGGAARSGLMSAVFDKTNSKYSLFIKGHTLASIARRLKYADGHEPDVGTEGVYDSESQIYIEILKENIAYVFSATAKSANEMIAQLKLSNMREATDAQQKAAVFLDALDSLEDTFSSTELAAHSFAGFKGMFLNVPPHVRLFLLSFTCMYSATHDGNADLVLNLTEQMNVLLDTVWQEQYQDNFISYIEALLFFREQFERLQATQEFKKRLLQILEHIRYYNNPQHCEAPTPMMMTCKTITVDPLMAADDFLLALVAVKEQQAKTDLAHQARHNSRQKVTHGSMNKAFVGAIIDPSASATAPKRRGSVQPSRGVRFQRPASASRAAAPSARTEPRPQSAQQVAPRNQSNFPSNANAPRGTQQRQRYVNAVSGGASQEHQSYYGQCCAPTTCAYVGLTNARSREPACQRKHAARTFKGTLDDLINFNKSQGWPEYKFSSIEARKKRERDLTRQPGSSTMHQASAVSHASNNARRCAEY